MTRPFRLVAGDVAPAQQSHTTCGSASLTIARMLANPDFARWVSDGVGGHPRRGDLADRGSATGRFAAYEQVVARRTNALVAAGGGLQLPWPRALGTPPWGARAELELGASDPSTDYDISWFRAGSRRRLGTVYAALRARVRDGAPALLYVGNGWLPRHVVLVLPASGAHELDVYEPSSGQVVELPRRAFESRRLQLAGWDVPWAAVWADNRREGSSCSLPGPTIG